jgi:SAM-dependent methyltransferase
MRRLGRRLALLALAVRRSRETARNASSPHFVREYRTLVRSLIEKHPLDEAMALAVGGGDYDRIGIILTEIIKACGINGGEHFVDLGCGSGRLAKHLGIAFPQLNYFGIDVVQELIDYAATKTPPHFRFALHHDASIPCHDNSIDIVAAFSVFTHLYHEESFTYLKDIRRALRPGGRVVFSIIEFAHHWPIFEALVSSLQTNRTRELTMFIERQQVAIWADDLKMETVEFNPGPPTAQTIVVLRKPLA